MLVNQILVLYCYVSHVRCEAIAKFDIILLHILYSIWLDGKCLRRRWKKALPMLVET